MFNRNQELQLMKTLWRLMLPIALQNLLSAVVNTADVLMLGGVSANALSASSLAGQVTFVLNLFYLGISTGASVLAAQYWGRRDRSTIERIQGMSLRYCALISLVFFFAACLIPDILMRAFTNDPTLIALGVQYLRYIALSYLFMGVSQILLTIMKSIGQTRVSAEITIPCLLCNITLNAISIYGLFHKQEINSLRGVAGATAISRALELALCLVAIQIKHGIRVSPVDCLHTPELLRRDFRKCALPVQANYLIWGCATAGVSAILGRLGSEIVAANAMATTLRNLVIVGCNALGTAGSIHIGNKLGCGDLQGAKYAGIHIKNASLVLGALSGLMLLMLYPSVATIARMEADASSLFFQMVWINALYCIGKAYNSSLVGGIFCAGGDTRFGLVCDTIAMWCVILPLGLLCAFVFKLPPIVVYAVLCMDETVKLPFVAIRFRKYRWLQNLTRDRHTAE